MFDTNGIKSEIPEPMDFVAWSFFILFLLLAFVRTPLFIVLGMLAVVRKFVKRVQDDYGAEKGLADFFFDPEIKWGDFVVSDLLQNADNKMTQESFLVAIPLFCLVGYLLAYTKTPNRVIDLINSVIGRMPGSLGIVTILACAFFTPFTGASGITIIALGGLLYPILMREKYSEKYALGVLTSSGSIGLLFFPSIPIMIMALVAHNVVSRLVNPATGENFAVDIASLYWAGILPGLLLIAVPSIYTYFMRRGQESSPELINEARANLKANWGKTAAEVIFLPIVLVLFFTGLVHIEHTGLITLVYFFVLEVLIFKEVTKEQLFEVVREGMMLTGGIIVIIISAQIFTDAMIDFKIGEAIAELFKGIESPIVFLIVLNLILLGVGALMDVFSAILVVVPLLIIAAVSQFNMDPYHFCIIFLTNLEIGYCTPPFGLNLFISSFRFNKPLLTLFNAAIPFLGMMLISLVIITYVPPLSTALVPPPKSAQVKEKQGATDEKGSDDGSLDGMLDDADGAKKKKKKKGEKKEEEKKANVVEDLDASDFGM